MAFRLRSFLIGLLIFGTITTGALTFTGSLFDTYDSNVDTGILKEKSQQVFNRTSENINSTRKSAEEIGTGVSAGLYFLKSIWDVLKTTITSIPIISFAAVSLSQYLGIPTWFTSMIILSITIKVIYELVSMYKGIRS